MSATLFMGLTMNAQFWDPAGNPIGTVNTFGLNFLGSDATNPTWIKMGVFGNQDIFVDDNHAFIGYPAAPGGANPQGGHWIGLGSIFEPLSISGFYNPKAHLHIHGNNTTTLFGFTSGLRNWFETGTLYTEHSDHMYVGLRHITNNQSLAMINWGDDGYGGGGTDFMTFNFTGSAPGTECTAINGMELARFSPVSTKGTFGVGNYNFIGPLTEPVRRLEILDYDPGTGANAGLPQLRTTYAYNSNPALGVYTEFQTTFRGDMYFNTSNQGNPRRFGFHNAAPGNVVEISSQPGSPYWPPAAGGSSGLRLTNLTSGSTPMANPGPGLLGVDGSGDIVYVDGVTPKANEGCSVSGNFVQLGASPFPGWPAILTTNRFIPMNGQRIYMHGNNVSDGLTIGSNGGLPAAKLQVQSNEVTSSPMGIYAESINTNFGNIGIQGVGRGLNGFVSYGLVGEASDSRNCIGTQGTAGPNPVPYLTGSTSSCIGIVGQAYFTEQAAHIGVAGNGSNSDNVNLGGEFYGLSSNTTSHNYGVYSVADGGFNSWGVGVKTGTCTLLNYGVYSVIDGPNNLTFNPGSQNRAIYGKTQLTSNNMAWDNYAGWFDGDVFVNGTTYCPGGYFPSDLKLKRGIDTITNALGIIKKLEPRTYFYDTINAYNLNLMSKKQYGFISQDVYKILPELTTDINKAPEYDSTGKVVASGITFKGLNYNGFFAIMMKGIQEQQRKIDSLITVTTKQDSINKAVKGELDELRRMIQECCQRQSSADPNGVKKKSQYDGPDTDVNLNNKDVIVLDQNVPNPFAEQTSITFNIPVTVKKAQIIFYNSTGNIIQTADITTRGRGKVNVFAADLSSGLYNYTLVADGKVIDSKKMVRE